MMQDKKQRGYSFLAFSFGILLIAVFIQISRSINGNTFVFPGVDDIAKTFFRLICSFETYSFVFTSLVHLLESLIISFSAGILIGIVNGINSFIRKTLQPVMIFVRSIPMLVLIIIIMTLTSYKNVPVVAACIILVPLVSEAVTEGFKAIDPELIDVYRLNSNMNLRILTDVYFPLISGYVRQAYNNAAGFGLKIIISAEYLVQTRNSLGKAVYSSSYFNEYAEIYGYALIMILIVFLISELPVSVIRIYNRKT